MSEDPDSFTKVTPGRGKKTNIVTPNSKHPTRIPKYQSELTARASLFPTEEDWVEINMGTNTLIKLETLLPEMRPCKQPTTKDVITFRSELISALSKCPDPLTDQGYAYIIETESEYQARTDPQLKQTVTPVRPKIPHGNNNNSAWKTYEIEQTTFKEYQHYAQQTLEAIDIKFPGQLERRNGQLPQGLKPDTAISKIAAQVADTIVSQRIANNLIRGVMDRTYTPNQNGPREYFIESDEDMRMSLSIGSYPIPPAMVMTSAQQAFGNSGHQKDKIRAINEEWNLKRAKYNEIEAEYQAFKEYYTKQLKTLYTDTYKKHVAQQAEDGAWDKLSARIEDLEAQQEYLTALQSVTDTPTTISVPSGDLTETSSIETITNAVIAALVKSGNICNSVTNNNSTKSSKPTWRKVQYYCYTHGANVSHTISH